MRGVAARASSANVLPEKSKGNVISGRRSGQSVLRIEGILVA